MRAKILIAALSILFLMGNGGVCFAGWTFQKEAGRNKQTISDKEN